MRRPGLIARRFLTAISILLILLALAIWTVRPSPFSDWLNASGLGNNDSPLTTLRDWANDRLAPMTPSGFVTLFLIQDLLIFGAFLTALCVLLALLPSQWRKQQAGTLSTSSFSLFRLPRIGMRIRKTMILIAVIGLGLGWELVAWRNWRLREGYRGSADNHAASEAYSRDELNRTKSELDRLEAGTLVGPKEATWTPAARAAERAFNRDRLHRESMYFSSMVAYHAELRRKYERASADPSRPVAPNPPPPSGYGTPNPGRLTASEHYVLLLSELDKQIRLYPDLPWAHSERAWILATYPDARIRDGKRAVAAATRAAELTNWKDRNVLRSLAAAYAEAGDFANAVRWEQRGVELEQEYLERFPPNPSGLGTTHVDRGRLSLYMAGKPFRMRK
jgi:tetratricopeptide (TPR) repeat protein